MSVTARNLLSRCSVVKTIVKAVQTVLNGITGSNKLRVDGIDGPATQAAVQEALESTTWFKSFLDDSGYVFTPAEFLSTTQLRQLAQSASESTGVPESYLYETFLHENVPANGGVNVEFQGTFRGLGQFNERTWRSVMTAPWVQVSNHSLSALATARLYLDNKKSFLRRFKDGVFTDEIAYLYHNQGASAAAKFLETGKVKYPKQSGKALRTFAIARGQHYDNSSRSVA